MRSQNHGRFIWTELMTADLEAAGAFYSAVIGWNVKSVAMPDLPAYFLFEIGEGDDCAGIGGMMNFPPELDGKLPPNWSGYVAVDDVDQTCRDYVDHGGRVQRQPEDIPGIGRFAVVADPHGAVLCIMTPLPPKDPQREARPDEAGNVGWHELYAGDDEEAFDFYSRVFGWTLAETVDMGPMGKYRVFAHGGQRAGGMMTRPQNVPMSCWRYYFIVDGIDVASARITTAGGRIVNGPMEVPGGNWIVQALDPQGAFFCLTAARR
ncbi:VOC family protein [Neorhizobium sp. NPDC001467]|uniref:VOC family protein n=1 Tax=Neorhizobium sp. NPDC001467 TaxID=3390595 RepID=UPI003D004DE2